MQPGKLLISLWHMARPLYFMYLTNLLDHMVSLELVENVCLISIVDISWLFVKFLSVLAKKCLKIMRVI